MKNKDVNEYFRNFYNQNYMKAVRYANSYVFDMEVAYDIASQALMKLWEIRDELDEEKNLISLFIITVHNKCLDHLRREQIKLKAIQTLAVRNEQVSLGIETLQTNALDDLCYKELTDLLKQGMNSLDKKTSSVFTMVRIQGMSYKETAEELGISFRSVEYELNKATTYFRKLLNDYLINI